MTWRSYYLLIGLQLAASLAAPTASAQFVDVPYDGRYRFVRLYYSGHGCETDEGPGWRHDYPIAELNLMRIMGTLTTFVPRTDSGAILSPEDPRLLKYPVAYLSEPGCWEPSEAEVIGLRTYLLKGGFVIFDDFLSKEVMADFALGGGIDAVEKQLHRVLPEGRLVPINDADPIFKIFYDITRSDLPEQVAQHTRFFGIYEDNNPKKRLLVLVNYNVDIGEAWQWVGLDMLPIGETNRLLKFGVNYFLYGLMY